MHPLTRGLVAAVFALATLLAAPSAVGDDDIYTAHLSASQEVPTNASRAHGQAIFTLSADGTGVRYRLIVANLANPVAAHIHLGAAGTNGPVVAFLYGAVPPGSGPTSGVIATGTITEANLVGPLVGADLSVLVAAIEAGNAYVNVHTNDGDAATSGGPGDLPGGEIRGQIG